MAVCQECGEKLIANAQFCSGCGQAISVESGTPAATPTPNGGPLLVANGVNGQLEFYGPKVRIKRKGRLAVLTQGLKGDKDILIKQISSVQWNNAGGLTNGYIQFAFLGGQEAKGALFQATKDENSIMFNKKQQPAFEAIRRAIEQRQAEPERQASPPQTLSSLDQLEKLAELREKGILTEEEFAAKKKQLLGI